jgi:hypothetical protein
MKIGGKLFELQLLTGTLCTLFLVPMHTLTSYLMSVKRALHHFNPQSGSFDCCFVCYFLVESILIGFVLVKIIIESGTLIGVAGVSYLTRSILACLTSIPVISTLLRTTSGLPVAALVLGACYIVVLGMLCWYIKRQEKRLPYSYISNVGQLSFMGYGVLSSGPNNEGSEGAMA